MMSTIADTHGNDAADAHGLHGERPRNGTPQILRIDSFSISGAIGLFGHADETRSPSSDLSGGLNGSTQHFLEVYSQESESLKSLVGVDLSAALLCSDPTGNSRLSLRSSGSIVVRARLCFRSSRVARDSADLEVLKFSLFQCKLFLFWLRSEAKMIYVHQ